jgi:hypothetical protein
MKKSKKHLVILQILLLSFIVSLLSSCEAGNEIVSVEVAQLPYRAVYVAGVDTSLDMDGFTAFTRTRDGRTWEDSFDDAHWITTRHQVDFSTAGEYEVFFYWGQIQIGSMTIQVVAPD